MSRVVQLAKDLISQLRPLQQHDPSFLTAKGVIIAAYTFDDRHVHKVLDEISGVRRDDFPSGGDENVATASTAVIRMLGLCVL